MGEVCGVLREIGEVEGMGKRGSRLVEMADTTLFFTVILGLDPRIHW